MNFKFITGVDADDIFNLEKADYPAGDTDMSKVKNPTRYYLYNDPLAGLLDKHAQGLDLSSFYGEISKTYKTKGTNKGFLFEAFDYYRAVIDVLELKADFGLKLKKHMTKKIFPNLKNFMI